MKQFIRPSICLLAGFALLMVCYDVLIGGTDSVYGRLPLYVAVRIGLESLLTISGVALLWLGWKKLVEALRKGESS